MPSGGVWRHTEGIVFFPPNLRNKNFIHWSRNQELEYTGLKYRELLGRRGCLLNIKYPKPSWNYTSLVQLAQIYDFCQQCWNKQFSFFPSYYLKHALLKKNKTCTLGSGKQQIFFSYTSKKFCGSKPVLERTRWEMKSLWWPMPCSSTWSPNQQHWDLSRVLKWNLHFDIFILFF